jgi:hypothetical protein
MAWRRAQVPRCMMYKLLSHLNSDQVASGSVHDGLKDGDAFEEAYCMIQNQTSARAEKGKFLTV